MSGRADDLRRAIDERTATFGVIGQGNVGLPLAMVLRPGQSVILESTTYSGTTRESIIDTRRALPAHDAG